MGVRTARSLAAAHGAETRADWANVPLPRRQLEKNQSELLSCREEQFAADGGPGQGETPLAVPGLCRAVPRGRQRLAGSCLDSDGEAGAGEQALPFDMDLASQPWKDLSV